MADKTVYIGELGPCRYLEPVLEQEVNGKPIAST